MGARVAVVVVEAREGAPMGRGPARRTAPDVALTRARAGPSER